MNMLKNFIDFGTDCPSCGKSLTLFMSFDSLVCFKAISSSEHRKDLNYYFGFTSDNQSIKSVINLEFIPIYGLDTTNYWTSGKKKYSISSTETILMDIYKSGELNIKYNSDNCFNIINEESFRFFYICNTECIKNNKIDFTINVNDACYYRSSPIMKLKENTIELLNSSDVFINKHEVISIKKIFPEMEKVYILSLDFSIPKTKFFYYQLIKNENNHIRPKVLEKEFPMIIHHPDFTSEGRDKLLNKFDSWVLLS